MLCKRLRTNVKKIIVYKRTGSEWLEYLRNALTTYLVCIHSDIQCQHSIYLMQNYKYIDTDESQVYVIEHNCNVTVFDKF